MWLVKSLKTVRRDLHRRESSLWMAGDGRRERPRGPHPSAPAEMSSPSTSTWPRAALSFALVHIRDDYTKESGVWRNGSTTLMRDIEERRGQCCHSALSYVVTHGESLRERERGEPERRRRPRRLPPSRGR
jgi:hypothetical protein